MIGSESNMLGSDVKIVERTKDTCARIYAIEVTEIFVRKVDSKVLIFFYRER